MAAVEVDGMLMTEDKREKEDNCEFELVIVEKEDKREWDNQWVSESVSEWLNQWVCVIFCVALCAAA